MPLVNWNDRFAIGLPEIDEHRRLLFSLLNRLFDDFTNRTSAQDLNTLFTQLIDYTAYHFSAEERLLQESGFPGFETHMKQHKVFSKRVAGMHKDFKAGRKNLSLEILSFLNSWLLFHVLKSDVEFGRYVAAKNNGSWLTI